ncbi:MAG: hypothetical protein AAGA70_03915 [Pseudomonadota bacterium]
MAGRSPSKSRSTDHVRGFKLLAMPDSYPYDLGPHHFPITANAEAQLWFDRGLLWTYGFNHDEAVRCFERAVAADQDCAMGYWGIAYATGPNYNMTWALMDVGGRAEALARAHEASRAALACQASIRAEEAALIAALPSRFPQAHVAPVPVMDNWDAAFAAEMGKQQSRFPDSREIRAVAVEAMMQRTPWAMWDPATGAPGDGADTLACRALLEEAFADDPEALCHPGLLHLYVHLMEMSAEPEAALRHADLLRALVPDAGHLVHMATHIDVLCGAYHDVVYWNQRAVDADLIYYGREGAFNIYTGYRQHNYHFVAYGAMMLGQMAPALAALRGLADTTPDEMLRLTSPPMADYFESYVGLIPHVLVRFGQWQACLDMDLPQDPVLYASSLVNVLYAKAVALAALGRVSEARDMQARFLAACDAVPESRWLHTNRVVDIQAVAKAMVEGEILYREGYYDAAFAELRRAVTLEDGLNYDEPWGWMQPVRHALGALLLEQGRIAQAEACFRADLGLGGQIGRAMVHPGNVWALRGLHDCLQARGEAAEIVGVRQALNLAEARADSPVRAACACALAANG